MLIIGHIFYAQTINFSKYIRQIVTQFLIQITEEWLYRWLQQHLKLLIPQILYDCFKKCVYLNKMCCITSTYGLCHTKWLLIMVQFEEYSILNKPRYRRKVKQELPKKLFYKILAKNFMLTLTCLNDTHSVHTQKHFTLITHYKSV
jgi:hypothetical protein